VYLGLLGLLASFHGIVLGCSRQVFALARDGVLPASLARVHPTRRTPIAAILLSCSIGVVATLSGKTDALITMSVLGALVLYVTSMFSALKLRKSEPELERPFVAPLHPVLPAVAIALSCVAFVSVAWSAPWVCAAFVVVMAVVVSGAWAHGRRSVRRDTAALR
jgi:ethanolamine permease